MRPALSLGILNLLCLIYFQCCLVEMLKTSMSFDSKWLFPWNNNTPPVIFKAMLALHPRSTRVSQYLRALELTAWHAAPPAKAVETLNCCWLLPDTTGLRTPEWEKKTTAGFLKAKEKAIKYKGCNLNRACSSPTVPGCLTSLSCLSCGAASSEVLCPLPLPEFHWKVCSLCSVDLTVLARGFINIPQLLIANGSKIHK